MEMVSYFIGVIMVELGVLCMVVVDVDEVVVFVEV